MSPGFRIGLLLILVDHRIKPTIRDKETKIMHLVSVYFGYAVDVMTYGQCLHFHMLLGSLTYTCFCKCKFCLFL